MDGGGQQSSRLFIPCLMVHYPPPPLYLSVSQKLLSLVKVISAKIDIGMLISLWLFLFAAQPKEFFLDGIKKLEQ
jgi:hypothetical protein